MPVPTFSHLLNGARVLPSFRFGPTNHCTSMLGQSRALVCPNLDATPGLMPGVTILSYNCDVLYILFFDVCIHTLTRIPTTHGYASMYMLS